MSNSLFEINMNTENKFHVTNVLVNDITNKEYKIGDAVNIRDKDGNCYHGKITKIHNNSVTIVSENIHYNIPFKSLISLV